jgi:hypothetical protein
MSIEVRLDPLKLKNTQNRLMKMETLLMGIEDVFGGEILHHAVEDDPESPKDTMSLSRSGVVFTRGKPVANSFSMYARRKSKYGASRDKPGSKSYRFPKPPESVASRGNIVIAFGTSYAGAQNASTGFFSKLTGAESYAYYKHLLEVMIKVRMTRDGIT